MCMNGRSTWLDTGDVGRLLLFVVLVLLILLIYGRILPTREAQRLASMRRRRPVKPKSTFLFQI